MIEGEVEKRERGETVGGEVRPWGGSKTEKRKVKARRECKREQNKGTRWMSR